MCRLFRVSPSLLLHPLDFIGCDDVGELDFFPGMDMLAKDKIKIVDKVISLTSQHFELTTVGEHAKSVGPNTKMLELQSAAQ